MDSGVEKVPKEDFELSSDDELDLGIYLLIKAAGQKKQTPIIKLCRLQLLSVCALWRRSAAQL